MPQLFKRIIIHKYEMLIYISKTTLGGRNKIEKEVKGLHVG